MLRTKLEEKYRNIHSAFKGADADASGCIDAEEFRRILCHTHHVNVSEEQMALLLERFDTK